MYYKKVICFAPHPDDETIGMGGTLLKMSKQKLINISALAKEIHLIDKKGNPLTHVIRFWESKFTQLKPIKFSGNRRYYSKKDINLLKLIYELLKKQGYTIAGAKKLLNNSSIKLDDELSSGIKKKNFQGSLKIRAHKIKLILNRIKGVD